MKTRNRILIALLEIAIVLCSVFLVALPAIATEQTTQEVSASTITTASEDDYVLDIYGNANEDDTIDMRDLTYVKLIFFGKKPETELADAKYDGKINPLDFIQTNLIIVGKEKELTIIDTTRSDTYPTGRVVTVYKPIKRIIACTYTVEALRTLKSKDKIVGIDQYTADKKDYFPDISKLPVVGSPSKHDIEKILSLNPDIVFAIGSCHTSWAQDIEDNLKGTGIPLVRLDFYIPETLTDDIGKLGYILDKRAEAEEFIDFYKEHMNTIKERVDKLSEDEKPRVYLAFQSSGSYLYLTFSQTSGVHHLCTMAGGINIASDLIGDYPKIDPEWVIVQNPDIIVVRESRKSGYEKEDPSEMAAERQKLLDQPELAKVAAVEKGKVYLINAYVEDLVYFVGIPYIAKWFHPDLFEDLDPNAIHKEYLERFQGVPYRGVYVYPASPVEK